jgi:cob(I)alamin adenosyltransferase
MVVLNKIYTRTGDDGTTALGNGKRVSKGSARVDAYGTVDETNAIVGLVRIRTAHKTLKDLDAMLARIQNDLFDLGADLCCPDDGKKLDYEPLRIVENQTSRLEAEIDFLNNDLAPLRSFILPGGHPAAANLHLARTVSRRAERLMINLASQPGETVSPAALKYVNRLSDFFFVAARWVNHKYDGDVMWVPGETRTENS